MPDAAATRVPALASRSAGALAMGATAGVLIAIAIRINASLGQQLQSSLLAALVGFASGLCLLIPIARLRPATREGLKRVRGLPPWMYASGVIGAANVVTFTWVVPTIGTVLFTVAAVTGQILGGVLIDALGVGARGRRAPTRPRLAGAALGISAIAITQVGRPVGNVAVGLVAISLGVNVCVALQLALNGRLNQLAGDPIAATTVHFTGATLSVALALAVVAAGGGLNVGSWPPEPWLYLGGVLGISVIGLISITTRRLDVLRGALVINGGQLLGALVLDSAIPAGPGVSIWLAVGACLTLVAVAVAGRGQQDG